MSRVFWGVLAIGVMGLAGCGGDGEEGVVERGDRVGTLSGAVEPPSGAVEATGADMSGADIGVICDTITNSFRCARAVERQRLPGAERVLRTGDTLGLVLAGDDTLRLVDVTGDAARVVHYSYQDHWPRASGPGYFVIQTQYYEGSQHMLVDDSAGSRTLLPDRPIPAPGGARFAVLSLDLEAGYAPNVLQIWSLTADGPKREWETEPGDWGPTDGQWVDSTTLRFTQRGYCDERSGTGERFCDREATVRRARGEWAVQEGGPVAGSRGAPGPP